MKVLLHDLLCFIKGTIYYRLFHRGLGDFSSRAAVIPIHSYRLAALPGRRRHGMQTKITPAKVVALLPAFRSASSN